MNRPTSPRAHRVVVPESARPISTPDYASAFALTIPDADPHTAEQWARTTFEGAPKALRWFLLFGWTTVLRLRLGPRPSPEHVLGWTITAAAPGTVTLEVSSALITARKVIDVGPTQVTMTTVVHYERPLGRLVWSSLAPVHHLTEPLLLTRAGRNA
jgi:hypothetical protein